MRDSDPALLEEVEAVLDGSDSHLRALPQVLDLLLQRFDCPTGTVHLLDEKSGRLMLEAHRGIPDVVLDKIRTIPVGKGMAGIAAERREPVQVCNLQTDSSGLVRPGARDTKMEGSLAVPMLSAEGVLKGTFGIAKPVPYDFTPQQCDLLLRAGALIAERLEL
ncbi:MAG: GAF domain-containing protein [Chthoniobacterales bacterium]|nr:GAF domain-containing protein [Chthoniobacterales bacterium]